MILESSFGVQGSLKGQAKAGLELLGQSQVRPQCLLAGIIIYIYMYIYVVLAK